jgi:hypothetical protein
MEHPVFGPRQAQAYQHLVDWVALVIGPEAANPEVPQNAEATAVANQPPPASLPGATADEETSKEKKAAAIRAGVSPAAFKAIQRELSTAAPATKLPLRYGTQLQAWTPRDTFDPEIFNRQTEKAKRAHSEPASAPTESSQQP